MKALHEFDTWALAIAEPLTTTRLISAKMMGIYLAETGLLLLIDEVANGVYDTVDENGNPIKHPAREVCLLINKSLANNSADNEDFNYIIGNSVGEKVIANTANLKLAFTDKVAEIDMLLALCQAHCNITTYPYADITEEEYNAAVALNALHVETENVSTTYPADMDYLVKTRTDNVRVLAEFVEPVPADLSIPVYMGIRNAETDVIAWDDAACGRINIKAGETSAYMTLTSRKNSTTVHVVFKTVCPISTEHSLAITVA